MGSGKRNSMELLFLQLAKHLLARHEIQWFNHCVLKSLPSVTTLSQIWSQWGGPIVCIILLFVNALHFSSEWLAHCPTPKWEDNLLLTLPTADSILHGYPTYLDTITFICNFKMCHACHWLSQPLRIVSHIPHMPYTCALHDLIDRTTYTGYTQKNGAVSKVNKKFTSHLTQAQHTPSAAATVQVSHALITILQFVHPGSHDTHPHGNQIHPRLGVACPL